MSRSSSIAAAAIGSGSRGGTTRPVSPTASRTPPTSVETVARPQDIASIRVNGKPSLIEESITTFPAAYASVMSATRPSKTTESPVPSSAASASHFSRYASPPLGVPPNSRSRASGISRRTIANARISVSRSLIGSTRPAQLSVGVSGSGPAGGKAAGSTPLYTVRMCVEGVPPRSSQRRLYRLPGVTSAARR